MDVRKLKYEKLQEMCKEFGKRRDFQGVRAFVTVSDELDRRDAKKVRK